MADFYSRLRNKNQKLGDIEWIHLKAEHVGKMRNATAVRDEEIASQFEKYRNEAREASIRMYSDLLKETLSPDSLDLLEKTMQNDSEFANNVTSAMSSAVQDIIDHQVLTSLRNAENLATKNLSKITKTNNEEALNAFNNLLEGIKQAVDLMGNSGAALSAALVHAIDSPNKAINLQSFGQKLARITMEAERYFDRRLFTKAELIRIDGIIKQLNNLSDLFKTGKKQNEKGQDITVASLKKSIENVLFSTNFAEAITAMMVEKIYDSIDDVCVSLEGASPSLVIQYDNKGKKEKALYTVSGGKTDVAAKNVKFNMNKENEKDFSKITANLGISVKFYNKNSLVSDSSFGTGISSYSSGSGGTLEEALKALSVDRYFAYNVLAHRSDFESAAMALQDLILARQITRLFATTGSSNDFAQLMLVNGKVISTWSIVKYALDNYVGKSKSQDKMKEQAVNISLQGLEKVEPFASTKISGNTFVKGLERSSRTIKMISPLKIKAELHLEKLLSSMKM